MNRPILTIVRGLPGSGKSTYACTLAAMTGATLIEPDALLVRGGVYQYTRERYRNACDTAEHVLWAVSAFGGDAIYSDVLPTRKSVSSIMDVIRHIYKQQDFFVFRVHDMPLLTVEESMARNRHAVRREDIERMAAEWEPWEEKNDE